LKTYDSIADYAGQMITYTNLGGLYLEHSDTANASKYLKIAERLSRKAPVSNTTIFLYNLIGVTYAMNGKPDTALKIFLRNLGLKR